MKHTTDKVIASCSDCDESGLVVEDFNDPNDYYGHGQRKSKCPHIKSCNWCYVELPVAEMQSTVREPDVFYCRECFAKGLKIEEEAMYE